MVGASTISCVEQGSACVWEHDCDKCPAYGGDCTGTPDGTGDGDDDGNPDYTCGNAAWPACEGWCPEGTVCQSGSSAPCACKAPRSCAKVLGEPRLTATRISPIGTSTATTATTDITWEKPAHDYVTRMEMVVAEQSAGIAPWRQKYGGDTAQYCVVHETDINPQVTQEYLLTGLIPGKWYIVYATFFSEGATGWMSACYASSAEHFVTSCRMTPNPLTIQVGDDGTLQTEAVEAEGGVVYESSASNIATVTSPDIFFPYRTTVHGVGSGTLTVTDRVRVDNIIYCEDTATVYVGVEPPPTTSGGPWWQVVGFQVQFSHDHPPLHL